jgi:hypothetical protein
MQGVCKKPKKSLLFKECEGLRTIVCDQAHRRGFERLNGLLMECPGGFVFRWCRIPTKTGSKKAKNNGARNDEIACSKKAKVDGGKEGSRGQKRDVNVSRS